MDIKRVFPCLNMHCFLSRFNMSHRAEFTQREISLLRFDVLEHPPYSSDLAPMDFRESQFAWNTIRSSDGIYQNQIIISSLTKNWYMGTYTQ